MIIYVDKPFRLRTSDGVREFGKGAHSVGDTTADHWAMKAWLAEGRYRIAFNLSDDAAKAPSQTGAASVGSVAAEKAERGKESQAAPEAPATKRKDKA